MTTSFLFAGTSDFSLKCLRILMTYKQLSLKAILTRPDAPQGRGMKYHHNPVKSFAQKLDIPIWTPKCLKDSNFLQNISQTHCDLSFVCAYGCILPLEYLRIFPKGNVNFHLSSLPLYRGAAPIQRVLMAGEKKTGACLQLMTQKLDTGPIIGQRDMPISLQDNSQDLFDMALQKFQSLCKKELMEYLEGQLVPQEQDHTKATYAHKINKQTSKIVWNQAAQNIHNHIRALFLGPQAFTMFNNKRIKIYRSQLLDVCTDAKIYKPGEISLVTKNKLFVSCKEGLLSLLELQQEGKTKQNVQEFLQGQKIKQRSCFY